MGKNAAMRTLHHGGYVAEVTHDDGDELYHGMVINAPGVIHFAGRDDAELLAAFAESVREYEQMACGQCQRRVKDGYDYGDIS